MRKLFLAQFALWLLSLIMWGVVHAGEPGLVLPVLTQLAFLGLAGYLVIRPTLKLQLAFVVGVFTLGVMWAVKSEDIRVVHPGDQTVVIITTMIHVAVFMLSLFILRALKKEEEINEAAMRAQMDPGFERPPPPL